MPPKKRASSRQPSASQNLSTPTAKARTPAKPRASTRNAASSVQGAAPTPKAASRPIGIRKNTRSKQNASPIQIVDNPDKLLGVAKAKSQPRKRAELSPSPLPQAPIQPSPPKVSMETATKEPTAPSTPPSGEIYISSIDSPQGSPRTASNAYKLIIQKLSEDNKKLTLINARYADEREQHLYRNAQWEAVGRANSVDPNSVYALEPEDLDDLDRMPMMGFKPQEYQDSAPTDSVRGSVAALDLLHNVERNRELAQLQRHGRIPEPESDDEDAMDEDSVADSEAIATSNVGSAHPPPGVTPKSTGWGFKSFFSRILPSFSSPGHPIQLPLAMQSQIANSLKPQAGSQTSSKDRKKTKKKRSKKHKMTAIERHIVKDTLAAALPGEETKAKQWVQDALSKLNEADDQIGSKRKRLDKVILVDDLKEIPARAPWQSEGTFGMQDEFFIDEDLEEELEVPSWHALQVITDDQSDVPKKRRKMTHGISSELSSSVNDMSPRPAHIDSPMFQQSVRFQGGNIFSQTQGSTRQRSPSPEPGSFEHRLRRSGHIAGSGCFTVPYSSDAESDEEDESMIMNQSKDVAQSTLMQAPTSAAQAPTSAAQAPSSAAQTDASQPWTQAPPPPPTPAHASLPGTGNPTQSSTPVDTGKDRLQAMRRKATPHAPSKPSGLRFTERVSTSSSIADEDAVSAATGSALGKGLLNQPHPGGQSTGVSTNNPGSELVPSNTATAGESGSVTSGGELGENGTSWTGSFPVQDAPGDSVIIGPIPDPFLELTNTGSLRETLNDLVRSKEFDAKSSQFWGSDNTEFLLEYLEFSSEGNSSDDD